MSEDRPSLSTIDVVDADTPDAPVVEERGTLPRGVLARRIGLGVVVVFVVLGLSGFLGVRSARTTVEGGGVELEVTYGRVSRPGLATPLVVEVRRPGGFEEPVTLELDADYFEAFDLNGIYPSPAAEGSQGSKLRWQFDPPDGDLLRVSLDARISPARSSGGSTTVAVLDAEGRELVSTEVDTFVVP